MRYAAATGVTLATVALLAVVAACSSRSSPPGPLVVGSTAPQAIACDSTAQAAPFDAFAQGDVGVYLDVADPLLDPVRADLARYLGAMWGGTAPAVASTAPDGSKRAAIWLSTSDAAGAMIGASITDGYAIARSGSTVVVYAKDATNLAFGAYALLEELGARFFHPKDELVPSLGAPRLPKTLSVTRAPWVKTRGMHVHTLHPIEYMDTFMTPSAENLADAKLFIDWLVKTGQNEFRIPLLSTVPFDPWKPHMQAILDYARSRGVKVGATVQMWGGAALQNNYVLVTDTTGWQAEMSAALDKVLGLPWDEIDIELGEFVSADPQQVIDWLNFATNYLLTKQPSLAVLVRNHVGNYPQLYVQYMGQTVFYYHLPQFCDARLAEDVHTLSFFDMYRDWATYAHPDFHLQHDYLMKEVAAGRTVSYNPESAYWISADIDVPLFLPMHLYARWLDIHSLAGEIRDQALPPLAGHYEFMSGHEWGYWMTDYLVAKMLWEPDQPLDYFLGKYAAAYGSCASDVGVLLSSYVALQGTYLFDHRLAPYVQGENTTVDEGYLAGLETHPKRVEFEQVLAMNDGDRATFETSVVGGLSAFAAASKGIEDAVAARCRGADATLSPWCNELWDGVAIGRLRAEHAVDLYRAVLALARGDATTANQLVTSAQAVTAEAAAVIARREAHYRFDVDRVTGVHANPTVYGFGYLRPAHTQCYYARREEQVSFLIANGVPEGLIGLPNCTN